MLEAVSINKSFGGLKAVDDASLNVSKGEIVSLIGPNGAGKTTLFALISGFLQPDSGSVHFKGQDITGMKPHEICQLGIVRTFQVVQPFANLTVLENIAVGAHTRLRARSDALEKAREVARLVGMDKLIEREAGDLTVAGRKRLELARALATDPELLLLDEVMAGLNATEIQQIVETIRDVRKSGKTILLIEHVMQAVMTLSDRAYVLNQGGMIAAGTPSEVVASPEVIEAYLGHGAAERIAKMGGANA